MSLIIGQQASGASLFFGENEKMSEIQIETCTRRIQFCAGHRVKGHENKCANLHGHNYVAFVTARGTLDSVGRVIDFSVLKERVGGWIDDHWDHGFVLHEQDDGATECVKAFRKECGSDSKLYLMPSNPTAENMASYLLEVIGPRVLSGTGVELCEVTLWETENCYATARL